VAVVAAGFDLDAQNTHRKTIMGLKLAILEFWGEQDRHEAQAVAGDELRVVPSAKAQS